MSKRDGKMYLVKMLARTLDTSGGIKVRLDAGELAGACLVFWTKTAARAYYGRNVDLQTLEVIPDA